MLNTFRSALACLLLLWLPMLQAADSGWLQSPTNDHAKVRLRADTSQAGETRLLLSVELQKGWKTYWRSPGEGASRQRSSGRAIRRRRPHGSGRRRSVLTWRASPRRATTTASLSRL